MSLVPECSMTSPQAAKPCHVEAVCVNVVTCVVGECNPEPRWNSHQLTVLPRSNCDLPSNLDMMLQKNGSTEH